MDYYNVSIVIQNECGIFEGRVSKLNKPSLNQLKKASSGFYKGEFELDCSDGSYIVIPPDLIKKSILKIVYEKIEDNE
jgi:hypothetical protein